MVRIHRWSPIPLLVLGAVLGCEPRSEEPSPTLLPVPEIPASQLREPDDLLNTPLLQEVVELGLAGQRERLGELLGHESPQVRARAAFTLILAGDETVIPPLLDRLRDSEPRVRADASLALASLSGADLPQELLMSVADELLATLEGEEVDAVVSRLVEALGQVGGQSHLGRLITGEGLPIMDEVERMEAVVTALLRQPEMPPPGAFEHASTLLVHNESLVREAAATLYGAYPNPENWEDQVGDLRAAFDRTSLDDPARMHLVTALGRLAAEEDLPRLLESLRASSDWRVRVNAGRALGSLRWIEREGVRDALWEALDDSSELVAISAAWALTQGLWVPPPVLAGFEERLLGDPPNRWRMHVPMLAQVAGFQSEETVLAWTRRMVGENPIAVREGLAALAGQEGVAVTQFILELAEHEDAEIRAEGIRALTHLWERAMVAGVSEDRLRNIFFDALTDGFQGVAARSASVLTHPTFLAERTEDRFHEAAEHRLRKGDLHAAYHIIAALHLLDDPRTEELRRRLNQLRPSLLPDWDFLQEMGTHPRLIVETTRGPIHVRLDMEAAPVPIQMLARQVLAGHHDGVPLHRVEPNFVVQGGDFAAQDGSGGPGYSFPVGNTGIRFQRGGMGLATPSSGEGGSQFFLVHSRQILLDRSFGALGWVVLGEEVLDSLLPGDRVMSMTIESTR